MSTYNITYDRNGMARLFTCKAESEGEAQDIFENFADGCDDYLEILSIKEVE